MLFALLLLSAGLHAQMPAPAKCPSGYTCYSTADSGYRPIAINADKRLCKRMYSGQWVNVSCEDVAAPVDSRLHLSGDDPGNIKRRLYFAEKEIEALRAELEQHRKEYNHTIDDLLASLIKVWDRINKMEEKRK